MDEVDNIIIYSLKEIGCDFTDDVSKLSEFSVEMVVHAVAKCLNTINDQIHVSSTLPPSMSARFRIGSSLASACQDLGYKGEVGYQTFLYANEQEIRNVMMFLIEKLPKDTSENMDEPIGTSVLLSRRIAAELKRQLSTPWAPAYCRRKNVVKVENDSFFIGNSSFHNINTCLLQYPMGISQSDKVKQKQEFNNVEYISSQPSNRLDIYASIEEENMYQVAEEREWENEWNRNGIASRLSVKEYKKKKKERLMKRLKEKLIKDSQPGKSKSGTGTVALKELLDSISPNETKKPGKGSRFTHAEKLQFAPDVEKIEAKIAEEHQEIHTRESEEELQQKRDKEMQELRDELNNLTLQFQNGQFEIKQLINQKEKLDEDKSTTQDSVKELESSYKVKKKTYDLLPDADYNIQKLEQMVENSKQKLVNLNDQWVKHRDPLIEKYNELNEQRNSRTSQVENRADQVRSLREKMKSSADETKEKDELLKQLVSEYESMSTDLNRSAYTKRILEIVGNIKKQKDQIAKVLIDTKALQKDINFLTGKLDRTFIVTEELIFRDAKKDEFSRKAYKLLAGLHESFGNLVRTIEETGVIMREIRDLEDQIDNISEKEIDDNLKRIGSDLKQINKENQELINKIKRKR